MCQKSSKKLEIKKEERKCLICETNLYGRADKIFCGIQCKNKYHSEVRRTTKTYTSETLKIINKNWAILTSLMSDQHNQLTVKKLVLQRKGFHFDMITSVHHNQSYINFGVYNFMYYITKFDQVVITKNKDEKDVTPFLFKRMLREFPISDHMRA